MCYQQPGSAGRVVAVAADHGGFTMKQAVIELLTELGYTVHDFGTHDTQPVDYPDFAYKVAEAISSRRCWRGIVIDGAGIGSCMAANKVPGVRAACCHDVYTARNSREHNDANVLTLGANTISLEAMRQIVTVWLSTEVGAERHRRRVEKIMEIERKFLGRT
ncbi:MAG: ribose 5-phosphate isomerase B [Blastocatellia bacterium]|nr:ribose 5-phosphate isomerase B [Blastocatellia bacterium]